MRWKQQRHASVILFVQLFIIFCYITRSSSFSSGRQTHSHRKHAKLDSSTISFPIISLKLNLNPIRKFEIDASTSHPSPFRGVEDKNALNLTSLLALPSSTRNQTRKENNILKVSLAATALFSSCAALVVKSGPGSWRYYLAGGICAAISHGITTPVDVIKVSIYNWRYFPGPLIFGLTCIPICNKDSKASR